MTQLPLIMQCTDKGSMVRAQYCSDWTELGCWYGTLVRFLGSEMIEEGTTSIVCSYLRAGNCQKCKSTFLICPCHKIWILGVDGLYLSNYT